MAAGINKFVSFYPVPIPIQNFLLKDKTLKSKLFNNVKNLISDEILESCLKSNPKASSKENLVLLNLSDVSIIRLLKAWETDERLLSYVVSYQNLSKNVLEHILKTYGDREAVINEIRVRDYCYNLNLNLRFDEEKNVYTFNYNEALIKPRSFSNGKEKIAKVDADASHFYSKVLMKNIDYGFSSIELVKIFEKETKNFTPANWEIFFTLGKQLEVSLEELVNISLNI